MLKKVVITLGVAVAGVALSSGVASADVHPHSAYKSQEICMANAMAAGEDQVAAFCQPSNFDEGEWLLWVQD
ncbi:hypothetical protein [Nocardiopsis aegyptia]|uniref:Uncharacterized protein n=1 Tax=Nocardiopsis aegyptia TaxID=220378 RepID=A0A7Z0JAK2_9ACTN|nr:hypothetical protein [Nocardiopsis aegyptia]NYJ34515.1 hypothetical protein [Nocardiopsis aegyptia]